MEGPRPIRPSKKTAPIEPMHYCSFPHPSFCKKVIDALDQGNFPRRTKHHLDTVSLNAFILSLGQNLFGTAFVVERLPPEAIPGDSTHPVAQAEEMALPSKGLG